MKEDKLKQDFFFFDKLQFLFQTEKTERQSPKHAEWTTLGRLSLLKQKDSQEARDNFAVT